MNTAKNSTGSVHNSKTMNYLQRYWTLYLLLLLPVIYFIVFRYSPLFYLQVAFKHFQLNAPIWEMPWVTDAPSLRQALQGVGEPQPLRWFQTAFQNNDFLRALRNTLTLNGLDLILGFPAPIIMALILNELVFNKFKRITQTISYMPHFLSWIIISSLALQLFAPTTGLVNIFLRDVGIVEAGGSWRFLDQPRNWIFTYVFLGIWKNLGWGSIIYLAAMTAINPELYEAASVDGATRMRKIWHITLPGIRPTIITLLILAIGGIVADNFDRTFALRNTMVYSVSDVLAIFVYNYGLKNLQYEIATAVGIFQSCINVIFLLSANTFAKRIGERGIW